MRKFFAVMVSLLMTWFGPLQAESVSGLVVEYIYDLSDLTYFDFRTDGANHACGSKLYRVWSNDPEVVKRKLSLVMLAFASDSTLTVDAGNCWGNRRAVNSLRVVKR